LYKAVNPRTGESIEYLPPYSPELNPVERVFQNIKKYFKNKILENHLKSLTFYPYIKEAFNMI
jgi:transposase